MKERCEGSVRPLLSIVLWLFVVSLAHAAAPPPRLPVEAYGRLPAITYAAISPDGTKVVVAHTTVEGAQAFRVLSTATGALVTGAKIGDQGTEAERSVLRSVGWADDTHPTFLLSATFRTNRILPGDVIAPGVSRLDVWRTGIVDLAADRNYLVTRRKEEDWGLQLAGLIAPIEGDAGNGRLVMYNSPFVGRSMAVYDVRLSNGHTSTRTTGVPDTVAFLLDARGEPIARIDANRQSNRWKLFALDQGRPRLLLAGESETGAPPMLAGRLPDGSFAFVDDPDKRGRQVLYAVSPKDGATRVLLESQQYDVSGPLLDPSSHHVVGAMVQEEFGVQHFLEPDLEQARQRLQAIDPNAVVGLLNWSRDRSKFIAYIERANDAGGYYVFEPANKQLRLIGMRYPELTGSHIGNRESVTFPARDGKRIPGYLTLPAGGVAKGLPMVVLVHGGPSSRDGFEFDWWASFLASRGYVVVQPNYRGSDGYGREWEGAGYRQWGELMQRDVEDATAAVVRMGIADGARICIVGGSYGGYAALVGATLTPDRYRCAVSVAGVADLPMMLGNVARRSGSDSIESDWWRMLIGDRGDDAAHLRAVSPAYQAKNARAPILLIHGENDTVVPIAQSQRMAAALKSAGKPVRLVVLPGEDHWLSDAATRQQMLRELETFLSEQLGTGATAETTTK